MAHHVHPVLDRDEHQHAQKTLETSSQTGRRRNEPHFPPRSAYHDRNTAWPTPHEDRWRALFQKGCAGDGQAYAAFLHDITPVLRRIVTAKGSARGIHDAEDVVQDVLIALHTKRHTWLPGTPLMPWVYAIARHKAIDAWRKRGHTHVDVADLAETLAQEESEGTTTRMDVDALLSTLNDASARIVQNITIEGQSAAEVGKRMDLQPGHVRVLLHRALAKLKAQVRPPEDRT